MFGGDFRQEPGATDSFYYLLFRMFPKNLFPRQQLDRIQNVLITSNEALLVYVLETRPSYARRFIEVHRKSKKRNSR